MSFQTPVPADLSQVDPDDGVLSLASFWRPRPHDPNPEMPGEKASVSIYLPIKPADLCPCGSGLRFRACCRRKRYWLAVCRDPGIHGGYSLVSPQTATFSSVDGDMLAPQLMDDVRLHCVENTRRQVANCATRLGVHLISLWAVAVVARIRGKAEDPWWAHVLVYAGLQLSHW